MGFSEAILTGLSVEWSDIAQFLSAKGSLMLLSALALTSAWEHFSAQRSVKRLFVEIRKALRKSS